MKPTLFILSVCVVLFGCGQREESRVGYIEPEVVSKLTFSPQVRSSLKEKDANVVLDVVLNPGEERELPSVVGSMSIGYYIDDQFSLDQAGGFVRINGSDGLESGSSYGGEWRRDGGTIQASYKATNKGRQARRLLVYTTSAETRRRWSRLCRCGVEIQMNLQISNLRSKPTASRRDRTQTFA